LFYNGHMKVIHLNEINSTNDYVKKNISELDHLTFVYSDRQTSGRGRLQRTWVDSGDENLFLTIVIKPENKSKFPYANFTQYLCVILSLVLEEDYNLIPQIKWPNDVLINGKKIAGILAEGSVRGGELVGLALGIGVNLNTTHDKLLKIDKPATSIFNEIGTVTDKTVFLEKLYNKFCLLYDKFVCEGFTSIKNSFEKRAMFIGKQISINVLGEIHEGIAVGVTDEGSLILKEGTKKNIYYIGDIL